MTRVKSTTRPTTGGKLAGKRAAKKALAKSEQVVEKPAKVAVRRHKRGVVALRKIRQQAKSTDTCIQREPFSRFVREIAERYLHPLKGTVRFQSKAMDLIQGVTEQLAIGTLRGGYLLTDHRGADMLKARDIAQREELQDMDFPAVATKIRELLCEARPLLLKCEERALKRQHKETDEAVAVV